MGGRLRISGVTGRSPVVVFFVVAFSWTWLWHVSIYALVGPSPAILFRLPSTWGPLLGVLAALRVDSEPIEDFFRESLAMPSPKWTLAVAFLLPIAMLEVESLLTIVTGRRLEPFPWPGNLYLYVFSVTFFLGGSLEEFGWRAFAQQRLQYQHPPALIAVGIGLLWATWHLPLFVLFELEAYTAALPVFYATLVSISIVLAWLVNFTRSVISPMVFHAAWNMPRIAATYERLPGVLQTVARYEQLIVSTVVALGVLALVGGQLGGVQGDPPLK